MTDALIGEPLESGGERINALLVDDNEEWAELAASRIERKTEDIDISVAGSANEAMVTLEATDAIDCLVVDYIMPRVTGLQLLERIREEYPRLPYLLTTSEGSEDVAARAIDAGVTDYIVKDPASDQTVLLVSKIRSAVERYRLREAIEESEERYRTVIEQSRDALVILQREAVVFGNHRLAEITGRANETLFRSNLVDLAIHSEDRDQVRTTLDDWYNGRTKQTLHEARIVQPDGTIRQCECTGCRITYDGEPAILVSIRDVTDRKRREREIQWERELNRTVQKALVTSQTRDTLERRVTEQLRQYGYSLAWIGELNESVLVPRTIEGDESYVEGFDRSLNGDTAESEPSVLAARTGEPQFIPDFDALFRTNWRDATDEAGYRGGAAVPLVYNDVTYGVLAVYHNQSDRFDDTERHLLMELADTVAFAIHSLETAHALSADRVVTATVQIPDDDYYLVSLARDGAFLEFAEVGVQSTVPHDGETFMQYVTVDGGSVVSLEETLASHSHVRDVVTIDDGRQGRLQVKVAGPIPEAFLASQGVLVHSTTVSTDGATLELELPTREPLDGTVNDLEEEFDDVSVLTVTESERRTSVTYGSCLDGVDLTNKQLQALQAAFYHGYFEQPRGSTASAIAESLGVSHATFLQHLHRAQQKLFARVLSATNA